MSQWPGSTSAASISVLMMRHSVHVAHVKLHCITGQKEPVKQPAQLVTVTDSAEYGQL